MRRGRAGPLAALALALAGCPATRTVRRNPPPTFVGGSERGEVSRGRVVHVVERGETIWRIARAYGVDPIELMERNGISDPRSVPVGAKLRIPSASRVVEVPRSPDPAVGGRDGQGSGPSADLAVPDPSPLPQAQLIWPVKGVLYGLYGVRGGKRHDGIDIAAPEGTPVLAAATGTVIYAGEQAGYGAIAILRHDDGLVTLYAHNSKVLVEEGARVRSGEPIASVGQTGKTTGPHLHFEVREGTRPRNPLLFLP